jgi:hypothetical protein
MGIIAAIWCNPVIHVTARRVRRIYSSFMLRMNSETPGAWRLALGVAIALIGVLVI